MSQISFGQNQVGMVFDNGFLRFDENDVYDELFTTENGVLLVFIIKREHGPYLTNNLPQGWRYLGGIGVTQGFGYEQGPGLVVYAADSESVTSSTAIPYSGSTLLSYATARMVHNARSNSLVFDKASSIPASTNYPMSLSSPGNTNVTWDRFRPLGVFFRALDDSTFDPGFYVDPNPEEPVTPKEVVVSGGAYYVAGSFNGRLFLDVLASPEDEIGGGICSVGTRLNAPTTGTYVGFASMGIGLEYQEPVTVDPEPEPEPEPEPDSCSKTVNINITINGECDVQVDPAE